MLPFLFDVMKKIKQDLYTIRYGLILLIIYLVFMQITFGTVCPLKGIFHITCPGCGLSHATFYLFTGRIKDSFSANPSCFFWIVTIFLFFFDRYIKPLKIKPFPILFILCSLITLIIYIFRYII